MKQIAEDFPLQTTIALFQNGLYFVLVIVVYLEPDRIVNEMCQCDTNAPPTFTSKYRSKNIVEFAEKIFFFKIT